MPVPSVITNSTPLLPLTSPNLGRRHHLHTHSVASQALQLFLKVYANPGTMHVDCSFNHTLLNHTRKSNKIRSNLIFNSESFSLMRRHTAVTVAGFGVNEQAYFVNGLPFESSAIILMLVPPISMANVTRDVCFLDLSFSILAYR